MPVVTPSAGPGARPGGAGRRTFLAVAASLFTGALARLALAQEDSTEAPPDAFTPVRERYAALQSYADTGTVRTELQWPGAPIVSGGGRFTTFYRAPRMFFFEFVEDEASGGDRFVIWCDGGDFQSWWATTGQHEVYDGGRGALAFLLGQSPTRGASVLVPGLIFAPRAELGGAIAGLADIREAGEEEIGGRRFARIEADTLVEGRVVRPHPTTLWIDRGTRLVHKVLEDTPPGDSGLDRRTTLIEPQADIAIDDARFRFVVPG